jgi:GNAT superfamily N-acetyltransferase
MYRFSLIATENIYSIIPLLKFSNPHISDQTFKERLDEMIPMGYECVGVYDQEKLIGVSGLWIITKCYVGRHIEPDNVVIHPDYRSKGVGEMLMKWIYDYGESKGCIYAELNCYITNDKGHKFWFGEDFKVIGFHFQRKL